MPLPGGQDKFSRGVIRQLGPVRVSFPEGSYLENWFRKGDFWCHPLEFLFFSGPNMNLGNYLPHPCIEQNEIAQFLVPLV